MRTRLAMAVALLACAGARPFPTHGEPVVTIEGKLEWSPAVVGAQDLRTLPRRAFEAAPPAGAPARFAGLALAPLLADSLSLARDADTAVFHGEGGRVAVVPLGAVRRLKPVLADEVDGGAVAEWRRGAAPLVLAWPAREAPGIETDPRYRWWWVAGVRRVELLSWSATYGKALRVPPGAADAARLGAELLGTSCLACHRLRGVGGTRGPELTAARVRGDLGPLASRLRQHLRRTSGAPDAPELAPAQLGEVAAFLRAVEQAAPPEEEIKEPERPEAPPAVPRLPGQPAEPGDGPEGPPR